MKSKTTDPAPTLDTTPTRVQLREGARPGVIACGPYRVGQTYTVPRHEAERLRDAKGFALLDDDDTDTPDTATARKGKRTST